MVKKYAPFILFVSSIVLLAVVILFFGGGYQSSEKETQPSRVYTVGIIHPGGAYIDAVRGLIEELAEMGWQEGVNIRFPTVDTDGNQEAAELAAREFLEEKADVIYAVSTPVTKKVAETVKSEILIVFNIVGDPVGSGFAASYSRPAGNLTGCSNLSAMLSSKRLEIFREMFPGKTAPSLRFVTFYDPSNSFSQIAIKVTREAAEKLGGIIVDEIHIKTAGELSEALSGLKPGKYDGIFVTPDSMVVSKIDLVTAKAAELKIPSMAHENTLLNKGITAAYGANFFNLGVQCARIVSQVLRGVSPAEISIETPQKLDLTVSLKNADDIGFVIPEEFLAKADFIAN